MKKEIYRFCQKIKPTTKDIYVNFYLIAINTLNTEHNAHYRTKQFKPFKIINVDPYVFQRFIIPLTLFNILIKSEFEIFYELQNFMHPVAFDKSARVMRF